MFAQLPDELIDEIMSRARDAPMSALRFLEACGILIEEDDFTPSDPMNAPFPSLGGAGKPGGVTDAHKDRRLERAYASNAWDHRGGYVMSSLGLGKLHRKAVMRTCRAVVIEARRLLEAYRDETAAEHVQSCLEFMQSTGKLDTLVLWWNLDHEEWTPESEFSAQQMTDIFRLELQPTLAALDAILSRAIAEGLLMGPGHRNQIHNIVLASTSDAAGLAVLCVLGRCFHGHTMESLDMAFYQTCREPAPNYDAVAPDQHPPLSVTEVSIFRDHPTSPHISMVDRYIVEVPGLLTGVQRLRLRQFDTVTASYLISRMPSLRQIKLRVDEREVSPYSFRRHYAYYSPLSSELDTLEVVGYVPASFVGRVVAHLPRLDASKSRLQLVGTRDLDDPMLDATGMAASPTIDSILHIPSRLLSRIDTISATVHPGRALAVAASEPFTDFTGKITVDGLERNMTTRLFPNAQEIVVIPGAEGYDSDTGSYSSGTMSDDSGSVIVIESSEEESSDPGSDLPETDEEGSVIVIDSSSDEDSNSDEVSSDVSSEEDEEEEDPGSEFEDHSYMHENMEYED